MAAAVHRQLRPQFGATDVVAIAYALDITEIRKDRFDGFEGMLLTDRRRNYGKVLVDTDGGARRVRFSIAQELGHFLLESHVLSSADGFRCLRQDMIERQAHSLHQRQEMEANRFAIDLLAPANRLVPYLTAEPDLRSALTMRDDLQISLEAAVRRLVELHDEPLAAVVTRGGVVRYADRAPAFPWIKLRKGDRISSSSRARRIIASAKPGVLRMLEAHPSARVENSDAEIYEQTRLGRGGHAITLLWASIAEKSRMMAALRS
jgi:hypothetical protein